MIFHKPPATLTGFLPIAAIGLTLFSAANHRAAADQIVVLGKSIPSVHLVDVEEGNLSYRVSQQSVASVPLSDVDLIFVDQIRTLNDFNEAERLASESKLEEALVRYGRARRLAESFWQDLIEIRLAQAYDRASQIDDAIRQWLTLIDRPAIGPLGAARLAPRQIPDRRTAAATAALQHLDDAVGNQEHSNARLVITMIQFDIMHRIGDPRIADASRQVIVAVLPEQLQQSPLYEIKLKALMSGLRQSVDEPYLQALDRAIAKCPRSLVPSFLLVKGDALLQTAKSRDDIIRASWPYMHIVAMTPTDERAAEALFRTARIVERIGRSNKAMELLKECIDHQRVLPKTRRQAKAVLKRLEGGARRGES